MTPIAHCLRIGRRIALMSTASTLLVASVASAQLTGNLYGTVSDEGGIMLPGVTVTIEGMGAPRLLVTDGQGQFRFVGLDPGVYYVKAALDGFSTVEQPNVVVSLNRNTTLHFTLSSAVEEVITVTSESPLIDERKLKAGTTVSQIELEKIPTARDPWSLLSQTPGVHVDRINVGGSESGQQSVFYAPATQPWENDFLMDGIQITDMTATGFSATYYDFEQFAAVEMTTGGTDVTKATAGVELNMVTKRGSNEFRGSARFYVTDADGYFNGALRQSKPNLESEMCRTGCPTEQTGLVGSQINRIENVGFEAGGAVVQDRLWLWGSWGQNEIKTFAASGDADDTLLENTALKMNVQITPMNSAIASYNSGNKIKNGRGAGPSRAPETLHDQRGPTGLYRFEDTHIFSASFFLTGTYSLVDGGFQLIARGPSDVENGLDPAAPDPRYDADGVWRDNFRSGTSKRPTDEFKIDASYFFNTGAATSHEVKIGGRLRSAETVDVFSWGPRNVFQTFWGTTVAGHSQSGPAAIEFLSLWVQDTITVGNLTINAGLRYDEQTGETLPASIPAHQVYPEVLPAIEVARKENISIDAIQPRLGLTYALGEERDTLLRASFSQFASQLGGTIFGNWTSPTMYNWYAYFWAGELYAAVYFDPLNPAVSPNTYGKLDEMTSEVIVGVEHSVVPELVVGANVTWRNTDNALGFVPNVRDGAGGIRTATIDDFVQVGTISGSVPRSEETYSFPVYDLACGNFFDPTDGCATGGSTYGSGPRERDYLGYSLTLTKRLANRWMARGFVNYGKGEWNVSPNNLSSEVPGQSCLNPVRWGGCNDGDQHGVYSGGSGKGGRFVQSTWSFNLNGMYQVAPDRGWGFNISTNIAGREGTPIPYYDQVGLSTGAVSRLVVDPIDRYRLDDPITVDLRVEKEFAINGPINLVFGIDLFNALNDNTGLSYNPRTDISRAGWLEDNVSPRIYRLGVRLNWK